MASTVSIARYRFREYIFEIPVFSPDFLTSQSGVDIYVCTTSSEAASSSWSKASEILAVLPDSTPEDLKLYEVAYNQPASNLIYALVSSSGRLYNSVYQTGRGELSFNNPNTVYPCILFIDGNYFTSGLVVENSGYWMASIPSTRPAEPATFPPSEVAPPPAYNGPYPITPSSPGGGGGSFGNGVTSDPIDIPSGGAFGSTGAVGSFTRYLCSPNLLKALFDRIWTNDWGMNFLNDVLNGIFGDASQSIISIVQFPFQIANQGTLTGLSTVTENFYWGRWNSGISTSRLASETIKIDWGELSYSNQPNSPTGRWFGNFMDYAPYTKVDLYLPWCTGFVNLDVNEFYPGSIKIETYVDLVSGSCVHNVWGKQADEAFYHVIGCYSGQCGRALAWNSDDWAAKVGKVTMASAGLVAGAVVGGAAALAGTAVASTGASVAYKGAISTTGLEAIQASHPGVDIASGPLYNKAMAKVLRGQEQMLAGNSMKQTGAEIFKSKAGDALQGINAATNQPVNVSRSGSFTDGNAGIQPQYPYLVFSRPKLNIPDNYPHYFGLPSNIYSQIGTLSGYTEISECHWSSLGCTFEEQAEIDRLMKAGVIL